MTATVTEEVSTPRNLWDPVPDPGQLRVAAAAWTALGTALTAAATDLGQTRARLRLGWTGAAADAFDRWAGQVVDALEAAESDCDSVAEQLQKAAEAIDEANAKIHQLYISVIAGAIIAVAATVFTLGLSDAAEAAAVAAAAAEAGSLLAVLYGALAAICEAAAAVCAGFVERWAAGFVLNAAFVEDGRLLAGQGLGLTAEQASGIVNGATGFALVPGPLAESRPLLAGAIGGVLSRSLDDVTDGKAPTLGELAVSGAAGAVTGKVLSWVRVGRLLGIRTEPETDVSLGDPIPGTGAGGSPLLISPESPIVMPQAAPVTIGGQPVSFAPSEGGILTPQAPTSASVGGTDVPVTQTASGLLVPSRPAVLGPDGAPLTSSASAPVLSGASGVGGASVVIPSVTLVDPATGAERPIVTTVTPADPVFVQSMSRALDPLGDALTKSLTNATLPLLSGPPLLSQPTQGAPVVIPPAPLMSTAP